MSNSYLKQYSIFTTKWYNSTKKQTVTLVLTTPLIGLLPAGRIRRFCGQMCYITAFRTMVRGICGVVTYHDIHHKPKTTGLCVANHTSTIDVAILSSNHCYSMVGFFFKLSGLSSLGIMFFLYGYNDFVYFLYGYNDFVLVLSSFHCCDMKLSLSWTCFFFIQVFLIV